jgi:hypothetical protein
VESAPQKNTSSTNKAATSEKTEWKATGWTSNGNGSGIWNQAGPLEATKNMQFKQHYPELEENGASSVGPLAEAAVTMLDKSQKLPASKKPSDTQTGHTDQGKQAKKRTYSWDNNQYMRRKTNYSSYSQYRGAHSRQRNKKQRL